MSGEPLSRHPTAPTFDRLENFNFLVSRQDPSVRSRHYSFDGDSAGLAPFTNNVSMDFDQTEGMGGLSVSSYDSVEDDRSSIDLRGYPYHGKSCYIYLYCAIFVLYGSSTTYQRGKFCSIPPTE